MVGGCSTCGASNPVDAAFCQQCGASLGQGRSSDQLAKKVLSYGIETGGAKRVSRAWVIVPILFVGPALIASFAAIVFALANFVFSAPFNYGDNFAIAYPASIAALGIAYGLLAGVLVYKLLNRYNRHADREDRLRSDLMAFFRSSAPPEKAIQMREEIITASGFDGQTGLFEKRLNAKNWGYLVASLAIAGSILEAAYYSRIYAFSHVETYVATLTLIGIGMGAFSSALTMAVLLLANHLMAGLREHALRWRKFVQSINTMFVISGRRPTALPYVPSMPRDRPIVMYAAVTALTFGIFGFYWLYAIIKDPDEHIEEQATTESEIFNLIRRG